MLEASRAAPPVDWLARLLALQVQPPMGVTVRRFGRPFDVTVGWAILPPGDRMATLQNARPAR